jgi:hypothetical protein
MGNRNRLGAFQPVSNLLGTPLVTQFALDPPTTATRPFERTTHLSPVVLGALVRDLSKVAIGAFIAFQLTRDRRAVHTDHLGNPTGAMAGFVQRRYFVSLRLGQLAIFLHMLLHVGLWNRQRQYTG